MQAQKFSLIRQLKSFKHAFAGLSSLVLTEHNARIHFLATVAVIVTSVVLGVSRHEGLLITIAVGLVWTTEMFNTCIEKTMDFISMETHPEIKSIKDISAGAVLIASVTAFIIGLVIFIPKIL
ncbi:MAG TPA: diacylglycerol kinase family protein [Puia sp.]|jgi:diacylglycerol kinase (ATP)|nr:diacylglycerol kinase family protein [Puia sp.]